MNAIAFALITIAVLVQLPAQPPPVLSMVDQFDKPRELASLRGAVVVLVYGDRQSADANRALGERLHVLFHPSAKGFSAAKARLAPVKPVAGWPEGSTAVDVKVVPIACVGPVPGLVRSFIQAEMRRQSPELPLWLDFQDAMRKEYGVKAGIPNVAVFDARGIYRYAWSGDPRKVSVDPLIQAIEALQAEAGPVIPP